MYLYQYEVSSFDSKHYLSVYDRYGRRHFITEINDNKFELYLKSNDDFQQWMESTFDDVFEFVK